MSENILNKLLGSCKDLYKQDDDKGILIEDIVLGDIFTGVRLNNNNAGIAYNFNCSASILEDDKIHKEITSLCGYPVLEVVSRLTQYNDPLHLSIYMAMLSSLSQPFITREFLSKQGLQLSFIKDYKSFSISYFNQANRVLVVGMSELVHHLIAEGKELYVTEIEPKRFTTSILYRKEGYEFGPNYFSMKESDKFKELAVSVDAILITCSTVVNLTFDKLMSDIPPNKQLYLYGPTASLYPVPFFDFGFDGILSYKIKSSESLVNTIFNGEFYTWELLPTCTEPYVITKMKK